MKVSPLVLMVTLMVGLLAAPLAVEAQQAVKVWKIAFLGGSPSALPLFIQAFQQELRELGYVEGQNIAIEHRYAEGRAERLPALAADLVRLKVDVIVVDACGAPLTAASQATSTVPIVVAACNEDLVSTGLISSLARPGGNITGLSELTPELGAKRLWRDFVNHTFMELIDSGKYFELYDKWFGERGVVPYPMSDQVRDYMLMQSMPE